PGRRIGRLARGDRCCRRVAIPAEPSACRSGMPSRRYAKRAHIANIPFSSEERRGLGSVQARRAAGHLPWPRRPLLRRPVRRRVLGRARRADVPLAEIQPGDHRRGTVLMTFLLALLAGIVGSVTGYLLAAAGGAALASLLGISSFEGEAGYFGAFLCGPL